MKRRIAIWSAAAGAAALIAAASLPMRLALDGAGAGQSGLSARMVSGSIWNGRLVDAKLGALPLGDIEASLSPLALAGGAMVLDFARNDASLGGLQGRLHSSGARGVSEMSGAMMLGARIGPVSVGKVALSDVRLRFDRSGKCREAGGNVTLALAAPVAGLSLAQGLSGPLRCADGQVEAMLASQSGMEKLKLNFGPDGAWKARFSIAPTSDAGLAMALAAMGFASTGAGYILTASSGK